jgi:hypothetical protein
MSSPNIVLSVWQLTIMAVVPVVLLFGWLAVVLFVGRETRVDDLAATGNTPGAGADGTQLKHGQPAGGRLVA